MNAPKLRFKEFNDEWKITNINEQCEVFGRIGFRGYTTNDLVEKGQGAISLSPSNIKGTSLNIEKENTYISMFKYEESPEIKIYNNDIIFVKTGSSYGKVALIEGLNELATINPQLIVLKNIKCNNKVLCELLNDNRIQIQVEQTVVGGTIPTLSQAEFKKYKFYLPQENEQNKIGKLLKLLDKKIELQTKKIENLKLFKLYTENSLLNSSSSIHWKKLKLNDILIEGNKEPVKNTNDFKKITIKLNLNGLEFNESKREMSDKRPFYIREENEIIIGKQNYFNGSIAIVTKEFSGCICSNAIMSFKVKKGYNLKYIYLYLSQKRYMKEREFLANGTGQKELSEKEFLKFTIKVPEDSVVNNITNIIDKINKKINFENNKLNKLIELKKGLMQNMFV